MDKSAQSMTQNELAHSLNTNRLLVGMCVAGVLAMVVQLAIEVVSALVQDSLERATEEQGCQLETKNARRPPCRDAINRAKLMERNR